MNPTKTVKDSSGRIWEILPVDNAQNDLSFKIIVIGNSAVGKSCLTTMATKNYFEEKYKATVGFEYFSLNLRTDDLVIKLQIWDTFGQELYQSLITSFYRTTSLAIIIYSIDNRQSFDDVDIWLKELKMNSSPDTKVFLIGNKADLELKRQVTTEEGQKYANDFNFNFFLESSAKTGLNAQAIFVEVAKTLYEEYLRYKENSINHKSARGLFKPFTGNNNNNNNNSNNKRNKLENNSTKNKKEEVPKCQC